MMGDKKEYSAIFAEAWELLKKYADFDGIRWKWNDEDDERWNECVSDYGGLTEKRKGKDCETFARRIAAAGINEIERMYKARGKE